MDKFIKEIQNHSFSNKEMMKLVEKKSNLLVYPSLKYVSYIDEIFKNDACIILYLTSETYGHWIGLIRNKKKRTIEFFDSYGGAPDSQLKYNTPQKNKKLEQDKKYLTNLLADSNYKIIYNKEKLQKLKDNNNVCGRWVAVRIQFKDMDLEKFINLFKNNCYDGDWMVTALTCFIN